MGREVRGEAGGRDVELRRRNSEAREVAGFSMGVRESSSWATARRKFEQAATRVDRRAGLAVRRAGLLAEGEIKRGIKSKAPGGQRFKKLSPITILLRRKGSRKPLMDDNDLVNSIHMSPYDSRTKTVFVGVHRSEKDKDGESLMNIAMTHEFGTAPYIIPVTPGVRRFFLFLHRASGGKIKPLSKRKKYIAHPGVPERPFIRPVFEEIKPAVAKIVSSSMTEGGGIL